MGPTICLQYVVCESIKCIAFGIEVPAQKALFMTSLEAPQRRMFFRAPGFDERARRSTGMDVMEVSREVSEESFEAAMGQMTTNLDAELGRFKERIKEDQSVQIAHRDSGYGGGGAGIALDWGGVGIGVLCSAPHWKTEN